MAGPSSRGFLSQASPVGFPSPVTAGPLYRLAALLAFAKVLGRSTFRKAS